MNLTIMMAAAILVAAQAGSQVDPSSAGNTPVLYRWTDFRTQINYGDRPPPDAQNLIRIDLRQIGEHTQSMLPYQVRRAAGNFPVMLFTAKNCPPCATAREFLTKRGIPFAERTLETADDSMNSSA
jgi:hypothetical protein